MRHAGVDEKGSSQITPDDPRQLSAQLTAIVTLRSDEHR
jgi:hypothetical protein